MDSRFEIQDSRLKASNSRLYAICLLILLSFLLAGTAAWSQDVQVTASSGSDAVGAQDQFQYTITVTGRDSDEAANPRIPGLQGFRIVSGPSVSSQYQWINGRSSSSKSFIYILLPEKEGQFTIGPAEVTVGGKLYKTQKLQIRVTSAPRAQARRPQRSTNPFDPFEEEVEPQRREVGDAVLIRAELDRDAAYPGQQVTLSYRLYTQLGISELQLQENPPLSGFWVEDLEVDKKPKGSLQIVNGREYQAFTIKRQALFATTTGKLKIPSSVFAISARTAGDIFGVFGRTETLYRRTQELFLDVKPLPAAGRPANFNNAVGSYRLSAGIDKTDVAAGDAVALHIKLEGQGNLKMLPDIPLPASPDFTIYSSKHSDSLRPSASNLIGGDRTWEYIIVPKAPGQHAIPSLSFSFFNADQGKYETVTTAPLMLRVAPGKDNPAFSALSGSAKQALVRRGTDINYIKPLKGDLKSSENPSHFPLWALILCTIMLACNTGLLLYQKRHITLGENSSVTRSRKARRNAFKQLQIAEKEGASDSRRFYDRAAAAFSGYLADKFNITEIELTGDNLERLLADRGIMGAVMEEIRACLQECDFGRFVSASNSAEKMHALSTRLRKTIDALEKDATLHNSQPYQTRAAV